MRTFERISHKPCAEHIESPGSCEMCASYDQEQQARRSIFMDEIELLTVCIQNVTTVMEEKDEAERHRVQLYEGEREQLHYQLMALEIKLQAMKELAAKIL